LDTLAVVRKAEKRGGTERREKLEKVLIRARELGCDMQIGGGRAGGMNLRYGSIGYAVMDINTKGVVKLYAQPHPNKSPADEHWQQLNDFIEENDQLEPKSSPINTYGHLEDKIEDIETEALIGYLEEAIDLVREYYYKPWEKFM